MPSVKENQRLHRSQLQIYKVFDGYTRLVIIFLSVAGPEGRCAKDELIHKAIAANIANVAAAIPGTHNARMSLLEKGCQIKVGLVTSANPADSFNSPTQHPRVTDDNTVK